MSAKWIPQKPRFRKYKIEQYKKLGEVGQFIYQIGELPLLRQKSKPVDLNEIAKDDFKRKISYLKKCLISYRKITGLGRGITAVQVGIQERFSVIYMPEIKGKLLVVINLKITKLSKQLLLYPEICMSASPLIAPVIRPSWIEFEYFSQNGEKKYWKTKDTTKKGKMYNRVFQHEIDHMDGIINIDRCNSKELIFEADPNFYDNARFETVK